eukprot:SAG31_NODE_162_length_21892_cov_343.171936_20_plen_152_part_00
MRLMVAGQPGCQPGWPGSASGHGGGGAGPNDNRLDWAKFCPDFKWQMANFKFPTGTAVSVMAWSASDYREVLHVLNLHIPACLPPLCPLLRHVHDSKCISIRGSAQASRWQELGAGSRLRVLQATVLQASRWQVCAAAAPLRAVSLSCRES